MKNELLNLLGFGIPKIGTGDKKRYDVLLDQANDALSKGDYERAYSRCDEVLQKDPKNTDALVFRGIAHAGKGDLDGAISDWSEAIQIDPSIAEAYANRGNTSKRSRIMKRKPFK